MAVLLLALAPAARVMGEGEVHQELNVPRKERVRENLLEMIFGSPPPMPTKTGKVILEAFHDINGNGRRDPGEALLEQKVVCNIDKIDYSLPAFIPGLEIETVFPLSCQGEQYTPELKQKEIFFKVPGEIISLAIPCRSSSPAP